MQPYFPVEKISKGLYQAPASPVEPHVHQNQIPKPQSSLLGVSSTQQAISHSIGSTDVDKVAEMTDLLSTIQS